SGAHMANTARVGRARSHRAEKAGVAPQARLVYPPLFAAPASRTHSPPDPGRPPRPDFPSYLELEAIEGDLPLAGCPTPPAGSPVVRGTGAGTGGDPQRDAGAAAAPDAHTPPGTPHERLRVGALALVEGAAAGAAEGQRA